MFINFYIYIYNSYTVPKKNITEFTKEIGARVENPTLKTGTYCLLSRVLTHLIY